MITVAQAAVELHVHQPLLVGESKVQHSASPCWLFYHLEKAVVISVC